MARFLPGIVALAALLVYPLQAGAARPLETGFLDPWVVDRDLDLGPASAWGLPRMAAAGAGTVRLYLNWRAVAPDVRPENPTDPAAYGAGWNDTDARIEAVVAHGLTPLVYIAEAPDWAEGPGTGRDGAVRPDPAELADFATAAATRYNGNYPPAPGADPLPPVRHWQVWNEPNLGYFLAPQREGGALVAAAWYRSMVNAFADAVHVVNGENLVIAGGTAPFGMFKNGTWRRPGPLRFMRQLLCLKRDLKVIRTCTPTTFDIWSHHPYTEGGPTHESFWADNVSLGDMGEMRRTLTAAIKGGKVESTRPVRFWVTEFSWDTKPPDPGGVPINLHARWTSEALHRLWKSGVSLVTWFKLQDEPLNACPWQSGFYSVSRKAKRSLRAFRFPFVAFASRGRVSVWGRTPGSDARPVIVQRRFGKGWRRVGRLQANGVGVFAKTFRKPWTKGSLRARFTGDVSVPFSLTRPPDRTVRPFGKHTSPSC